MKKEIVRVWIYRDYEGKYLAGIYFPNKMQLVSFENSFDKAKNKALQYIKHFPEYIVSAIIEYNNFEDVYKNAKQRS